jgi:hypothetical protein
MGLTLDSDKGRTTLSWPEVELYKQERNRTRLDSLEHWRVNLDTLSIEHAFRPQYVIALARCCDAAAILGWVFHLQARTWMTEQAQYEFLWLINLLFDPQSNMCRFENPMSVAEDELRDLVLTNFKSGTGLQIESGTLPFQTQ